MKKFWARKVEAPMPRHPQANVIYKNLVLTGLRKCEQASLTIGQLFLDGPVPYAADEKKRQGSEILLRADLADDLRI